MVPSHSRDTPSRRLLPEFYTVLVSTNRLIYLSLHRSNRNITEYIYEHTKTRVSLKLTKSRVASEKFLHTEKYYVPLFIIEGLQCNLNNIANKDLFIEKIKK